MSYIDEGYIKFNCEWDQTLATDFDYSELIAWRRKMWEKQWIGYYEEYKVGFGNISEFIDAKFIISGTQTGHLEDLTKNNFTEVTDYNIKKNKVNCKGPAKASSETLTHAIIYEQNHSVNAVIHIHNKEMWNKVLYKIPTTRVEVPYGTPEMADEIIRLFNETNVSKLKILAMAGHDDGIIAFGESLEEVANILEKFV